MGIDGIPKVKGGAPTTEPASGPATHAGRKTAGPAPEAMEKPPALSQPDAASTHPVRQAPLGKPSALHERELADLRQSLRAGGAAKLAAAKQALALAASYRMRRSRGARRQALELCADVATEVEELAELARALTVVLSAEGDLHETSAEATLRACRALVDILGDRS
jgi:hypothetical protein